jgi:hypothetical protein
MIAFLCFSSFILMAQSDRYGFGLVVVRNLGENGSTSKNIFLTKVVNLDSLCSSGSIFKKLGHSNTRYFKCAGDWVIEKIRVIHGAALSDGSEITNISQVESVPDYRNISGDRKTLTKDYKKADRRNKTKYMDRNMAEKMRKSALEIANRDISGEVFLLE